MVRAVWNGTVIAESDETVVIEGNHYFPADSVRPELLRQSTTTTVCPWKGRASYHTITVDGKENRDAAWFYPNPSSAASAVAGRVAFWHGVKIEDTAARLGVVRSSTDSVAPTRRHPMPTDTPTPSLHPLSISPTPRSSTRSTATRPSSISGHRGAGRAKPFTRSSITSPITTPTTTSTLHASTSMRTPVSRQGLG